MSINNNGYKGKYYDPNYKQNKAKYGDSYDLQYQILIMILERLIIGIKHQIIMIVIARRKSLIIRGEILTQNIIYILLSRKEQLALKGIYKDLHQSIY